jgi:hypothetical protein
MPGLKVCRVTGKALDGENKCSAPMGTKNEQKQPNAPTEERSLSFPVTEDETLFMPPPVPAQASADEQVSRSCGGLDGEDETAREESKGEVEAGEGVAESQVGREADQASVSSDVSWVRSVAAGSVASYRYDTKAAAAADAATGELAAGVKREQLSGTASAVGIDLGTTYSCVSVWRNGKVEIIPDQFGSRVVPSYVAFTPNQRLIGEEALNQVRIR